MPDEKNNTNEPAADVNADETKSGNGKENVNFKIKPKVKEEPADTPVRLGLGGTFRMVNGKRVRVG